MVREGLGLQEDDRRKRGPERGGKACCKSTWRWQKLVHAGEFGCVGRGNGGAKKGEANHRLLV